MRPPITRSACTPDGVPYEVYGRPQGYLLNDYPDTSQDVYAWLSNRPPHQAIGGFLLNKLWYRGRWEVRVRAAAVGPEPVSRVVLLARTCANRQRASLAVVEIATQ